jgi:hypothetical protein
MMGLTWVISEMRFIDVVKTPCLQVRMEALKEIKLFKKEFDVGLFFGGKLKLVYEFDGRKTINSVVLNSDPDALRGAEVGNLNYEESKKYE